MPHTAPETTPPRAAATAASATRAAVAACVACAALALPGAASPRCAGAQQPAAQQPAAQQPAATPAVDSAWPVRTREHVDLWLHGMAMLMTDSARVPLFRRAYQDSMRARRTREGVTTALDAERARLQGRLTSSPRLALNAQFVPLAFPSWPELRRAVEALAESGGDPRRVRDRSAAGAVALLAGTFPSAADREWARVFAAALQEELDRFYHQHWLAAQRDRAPALAAVEAAWRAARPRLQRFLDNTRQRAGELLLALPLDGEGRTTSGGGRRALVTVGFPETPALAADAVYAFVHEAVGGVVSTAVEDNTTPAEQREGAADRYTAAAQVRGGYLLLQVAAPDLATGYARYYLRAAGAPAAGDPAVALASAFPLPQTILDAVRRQIELTLEGI